MTYNELIALSLLVATAGTDIATNPVMRQQLSAEALTELALQELATVVAQNRELRQRLEKRFTVTLSNGEATIPAGMLSEYLREGSVRDSDTGANNGAGNIYARVFNYNQFLQDTQTNLGLYCLYDNKIIFRPPGYTNPNQPTNQSYQPTPTNQRLQYQPYHQPTIPTPTNQPVISF